MKLTVRKDMTALRLAARQKLDAQAVATINAALTDRITLYQLKYDAAKQYLADPASWPSPFFTDEAEALVIVSKHEQQLAAVGVLERERQVLQARIDAATNPNELELITWQPNK